MKNTNSYKMIIQSLLDVSMSSKLGFILEEAERAIDEQMRQQGKMIDLDSEQQLIKEIKEHAKDYPQDENDLIDFIFKYGTRNLSTEIESELLEIFLRPMDD